MTKARRFFRRYIFKSWDRFINVTAFLISILSLVFSVMVYRSPTPLTNYIIVRDYLIVISLVLIIIVLSIRRTVANVRVGKARTHWVEYYNHSWAMLASHKRTMFDYCYKAIQAPRSPSEADLVLFQKFCDPITQGLRETLKKYCRLKGFDIGEDISITVKLILSNSDIERLRNLTPHEKLKIQQEPQWAITAFQDSYTCANRTDRSNVDAQSFYNLGENTAFQHILYGNDRHCYCHNDLKSLDDKYYNQQAHWKKYYNATIVVPIIYEGMAGYKPVYFGFLSADSLNEDRQDIYDKEGCLVIMRHAADVLANFFVTLSLYHYQPSTEAVNTTYLTRSV